MISGVYIFDVFVLVLLLYGLVSGLFRGFFKEIGSIVGLLLAFVITFKFGDNFAGLLKNQSMLAPYADYVNVVAYVVLFLLVILIVNLGASFLLFFVFKLRAVKILNRIGGGIVGLIKGWLVATVIYFLVITFGAVAGGMVDKYVGSSKSAPYLSSVAQKMQSLAGETLNNPAIRKIMHPEIIDVPPPPPPLTPTVENTTTSTTTQQPKAQEQPMYIPEDDELFQIESFE